MKAHSFESSCRYNKDAAVGDPGVWYEFDIKMPKLNVDMTNAEFDRESDDALNDLAGYIKAKHKWIGRIHRAGRSGGWMSVEDKKGGATEAKLKKIIKDVELEKRAFGRRLEREYPG